MKFTQRTRGLVGAIAVALSLALPASIIAASSADARVGGGSSSGSRGSRTFSAPPSTSTAPSAAQPFNRSMAQPGSPGMSGPAAAAQPNKGGFFNRPGMGMLGGLAAGFLGAGLLGMLFGGGLFSGLGSLSSIIGLLLQIVLIVVVVRLAMMWWQRRNANANAAAYAGPNAGPNAGPEIGPGPQANYRNAAGFGFGSSSAPLEIGPADYEAFERLLSDVQSAWSEGDIGHLHMLATPEMVSYFSNDLAANKSRGVENKVSDVKLLQGDLAEAWREGETDYATVAMRFSLVDKTVDASGKIVEGSDQPTEATEVWTFARRRGSDWELSAIQQV
ncbi:putative lipid-binding transport protein (Tim44 family) [Rhodopseudomonas faecalis]|uniref:Putative lipid-binding transport protein (Tim44 family) n=1 Tax=Rhodopseudomonas faecalis TaxID=99655 RepID=A0A318T7Y3_9BRAD|nr:Tim44 domain-containing protein [Rhodopseudomonas faecalis]PYF00175.1 putative lipid-binding transport protein (Tim44 family) [Rhodopseudomonas faecalis]TAH67934.1 MAG: Tim44 domain-containing protein [Rhodopseudomonas palustris]